MIAELRRLNAWIESGVQAVKDEVDHFLANIDGVVLHGGRELIGDKKPATKMIELDMRRKWNHENDRWELLYGAGDPPKRTAVVVGNDAGWYAVGTQTMRAHGTSTSVVGSCPICGGFSALMGTAGIHKCLVPQGPKAVEATE